MNFAGLIHFVIPVQAGIQIRVCKGNRNYAKSRIPAFAGMTKEEDFGIFSFEFGLKFELWHLTFYLLKDEPRHFD